MTIRVGINGFGRIGRLALRAAWEWPDIEFVRVNDPGGDAATFAHLLNFDSVHGRWAREARAEGEDVVVGDRRFRFTGADEIKNGDWRDCDVVIEASGRMRTMPLLERYLTQGVGRVVVSAPVKEPGALNVVRGSTTIVSTPQSTGW